MYINELLLDFGKDVLPKIDLKTLNDEILETIWKFHINNPCYIPKCYGEYDSEKDIFVLKIYYDKQTHVDFTFRYARLVTFGEIINKVITKLDRMKNKNEENNSMLKENKDYTMSPEEASFNSYADKVRMEAEADIESKRREMIEAQNKAKAQTIANGYHNFFVGLINAGFNEDQAMTILLEKYTYIDN